MGHIFRDQPVEDESGNCLGSRGLTAVQNRNKEEVRNKMNDGKKVTIKQMIVHKVDHRHHDTAQLSDLKSPISREVASFLRQHILANREHRYSRSATFTNSADRVNFKQACDKLLKNPKQFVQQSRVIAGLLFDKMKGDERISPSDLVVCLFSEDSDDTSWLALLKMVPQDGFVGVRERIDGKVRIVLQRVVNVLPAGELQKCAFIVPEKLRANLGYDLKVLDQQVGKYGARRMIASFFMKDFLQCKVTLKEEDRTRSFVYGSHEFVERKKGVWTDGGIERFKERITRSVQDKTVNLTHLAQAIISKPQEQDEYLEYMLSRGLDQLVFRPDPAERRKLTQYAWFEGDDGLRIRIKADAVGANKTLNYEKDRATNTWVITIRTSRWTKKAK